MSNSAANREKTVPLSFVMLVMGAVIVLTVLAIWIAAPRYMPRTVYLAIAPYLPQTGAIPTRMAQAVLPGGANAAVAIPLGGVDPYTTYPDHFVSADEAMAANREGQPNRIAIPKLGIDAAVSEVQLQRIEALGGAYYQWGVPERYEAGWHNNSALLGESGNTVLNGHHNIHGEIFRDLSELEWGDEITLYDAGGAHTYIVTEKEFLAERGQPLSVRLENTRWIEPTEDERVTLVTCWPYTGNSHRLVIVAKPFDS